MQDGEEEGPANPRACRAQSQGHRCAERQQWRTDHRQQQVLDHVDAEEASCVHVDRGDERDPDGRDSSQPGRNPPPRDAVRWVRPIDGPDGEQVENGRQHDPDPRQRIA
jgi:hypothetical protein